MHNGEDLKTWAKEFVFCSVFNRETAKVFEDVNREKHSSF